MTVGGQNQTREACITLAAISKCKKKIGGFRFILQRFFKQRKEGGRVITVIGVLAKSLPVHTSPPFETQRKHQRDNHRHP